MYISPVKKSLEHTQILIKLQNIRRKITRGGILKLQGYIPPRPPLSSALFSRPSLTVDYFDNTMQRHERLMYLKNCWEIILTMFIILTILDFHSIYLYGISFSLLILCSRKKWKCLSPVFTQLFFTAILLVTMYKNYLLLYMNRKSIEEIWEHCFCSTLSLRLDSLV